MAELPKRSCLFCGQEAVYREMPVTPWGTYDLDLYDCPDCGTNIVGDEVRDRIVEEKNDIAFRLACILREHRLRGEKERFGIFAPKVPQIDENLARFVQRAWSLDELLSEFPKATEIIDRSLCNLSRLVEYPMETIDRSQPELQYIMFCPQRHLDNQLDYMQTMGLIHLGAEAYDSVQLSLSPHAWQQIQQLSNRRTESKKIFVAMWFDASMSVFEKAIEEAIQDAGFECRVIKNIEHNNDICDEIVAEIRNSRFVVADFTAGRCKKCDFCGENTTCRNMVRQRGGVYFEAGFALGLGIPVIWTVRESQLNDIHFDTRQYNYIAYNNAEELRTRLRVRIAANTIR